MKYPIQPINSEHLKKLCMSIYISLSKTDLYSPVYVRPG